MLALAPEWEFAREPDALTGYDERVVRAKLAELNLSDADIADAVAWARKTKKPASKA